MTETESPSWWIDGPHPLGVAAREIVVDRDDVHAPPGETVQHRGQGRHEGLALAGGHLRDRALVEHHAAHQLDVEVPHAQPAAPDLPHHREDLGQELVELGPVLDLLPQLVGAPAEGLLRPAADLGLEGVDGGDAGTHALDVALVLGPEDLAEDQIDHDGLIVLPRIKPGRRGAASGRPSLPPSLGDELERVLEARVGDGLARRACARPPAPGRS